MLSIPSPAKEVHRIFLPVRMEAGRHLHEYRACRDILEGRIRSLVAHVIREYRERTLQGILTTLESLRVIPCGVIHHRDDFQPEGECALRPFNLACVHGERTCAQPGWDDANAIGTVHDAIAIAGVLGYETGSKTVLTLGAARLQLGALDRTAINGYAAATRKNPYTAVKTAQELAEELEVEQLARSRLLPAATHGVIETYRRILAEEHLLLSA